MKKSLSWVFLFSFLLLSCGGAKQIKIPIGTTLSYDIVTSQKSLRLTATLASISPIIQFDYVVESEAILGSVSLTPEALKSAYELDLMFSGEDKLLSKSTSIRLSDTTFKQLKNKGEALIAFRQGFVKNEMVYKVVENQDYILNINDKPRKIKAMYLEDKQGKGFKFWIMDNPSTPIIMRFDLGWQMILKNIELKT